MAFASGGELPYSPTTTWTHGGQRFSSDTSAFFGALNSLADIEGGGTPLYDSSMTAVEYTDTYANNNNQAVIIFTDGKDTANSASLSSAIQYAKQRNIPLHTVALSSGVDIGVLSRMAGETGGSLTHATDARRLISYYGALGPYLSGAGRFYRATWLVLAQGGSLKLRSRHFDVRLHRDKDPGQQHLFAVWSRLLVVCPLNKLTLDLRGVSTVRAGIAVRRPVRPRASNRKIAPSTNPAPRPISTREGYPL